MDPTQASPTTTSEEDDNPMNLSERERQMYRFLEVHRARPVLPEELRAITIGHPSAENYVRAYIQRLRRRLAANGSPHRVRTVQTWIRGEHGIRRRMIAYQLESIGGGA